MARIPVGVLVTYNGPERDETKGSNAVFIVSAIWETNDIQSYLVRTETGKEFKTVGEWLSPYEGKQLHWYEDYHDMPAFTGGYANFAVGYRMAKRLVSLRPEVEQRSLLTDQADIMTAQRLDEGYRLFLHFYTGEIVEIKYGMEMPNGNELMNPKPFVYDFPKMIKNGDFGKLSD